MEETDRRGKKEQSVSSQLDAFELAIFQSSSAAELDEAYELIISRSLSNMRTVVMKAGAAKIIHLALRGYELPDAEMRQSSNKFLLHLIATLESSRRREMRVFAEELWLLLAGQRVILLETIEQDIDALVNSALVESSTNERQQLLLRLHKTIRTRSDQIVASLFPISSKWLVATAG